MQISLLSPAPIELPTNIKYLNISVDDLLEQLTDPIALVHADPPWNYTNNPGGHVNPERHYPILKLDNIAQHLTKAYHLSDKNCRLASWTTWPFVAPLILSMQNSPWKFVTGGSWHKQGSSGGVGYHWLGRSEPILIYKKGSPKLNWDNLPNAHTSKQGKHSVKPIKWMMGMLERWTDKGDTVLDLYAGLGSMAVACHQTGRNYIGAEICPYRWVEGKNFLFRHGIGKQ